MKTPLFCITITRVWQGCTSVAVWHSATFAHISPCNTTWSDWSIRWSLTNLIGWLFCDVFSIASFAGLVRSAKDGQKSCFERVIGRPISRLIFVWFCLGKKQCLSQSVYFNISTGNFWWNYRFKDEKWNKGRVTLGLKSAALWRPSQGFHF